MIQTCSIIVSVYIIHLNLKTDLPGSNNLLLEAKLHLFIWSREIQSVQEESNNDEHDETCKTTMSASANENPLENPKEEVWIRGKVDHMPRNVGNNELGLHNL